MRKHYTVLVIDHKGSRVRETLVSKRMLCILGAVGLLILSIMTVGMLRYARLECALVEKNILRDRIKEQQAGIEEQRKQIKSFAQTINKLKADLVALNDFENKVRIIANLEHKGDRPSLFSVGGSIPDDLDADLPDQEDQDPLLRQMRQSVDQINQASTVQRKGFETLLASLKDKRHLLAATPSLRPTQGWISSDFGYRISPFTGRKEFHKGLDIANREGTPIIAPADGVVTFANDKLLYGNMIAIDHGYGMVTRFGHIQKILKTTGDRVKRGDTIALMGNTGHSTGPHLHYEVRINGLPVNPIKYILD